MREANDPRLTNQERYLKGVTLTWRSYSPAHPSKNDHDHCVFCWAKFMSAPGDNLLHEGYSTDDRQHWVCKPCFEDFVDLFTWKVQRAA